MSRRREHPIVAALLSALIPGLGQWYAGRLRRGLLFFAPTVLVVAFGVVAYQRGAIGILEYAVQPVVLRGAIGVDLILLIWRAWAAIDAYFIAAPREKRTEVSQVLLVVIVLAIAAPHVFSGVYLYRGLDLVESVFVAEPEPTEATIPPEPISLEEINALAASDATPDPQIFLDYFRPIERNSRNLLFREGVGDPDAIAALADILNPPSILNAPFVPFEERVDADRLTILLVGGDAGPGRSGLRTDTMMVATIDTNTGQGAIFGLPRNMKYFPLPSHMHGVWEDMERREIAETWVDEDGDGFPDSWIDLDGDTIPDEPEFESCDCYPEMLNSIHGQTREWTRTYPNTPDPGMAALRDIIETILGLDIDYYVLVDMEAYVRGIDALGGVEVMVQESLHVAVSPPWEGAEKAVVNVQPGLEHLDGLEALAYARWRWGSSDYVRMGRQRCLVRSAIAQADPITLLANFDAIADVIQENVVTDIPATFLPEFVRIAGTVNFGEVATVGFVPPTYNNGRSPGGYPIPDVEKIQWKVRKVLEEGVSAQSRDGESECGI